MKQRTTASSGARAVKPRKIISYEPSGPVSEMIALSLRGAGYGAQTRLIEEAVVRYLGPRYPKLAERWQILKEEDAI